MHRLSNLESLELRVVDVERLVVTGAAVGGAELLGFGPRLECRTALPHSMGGIKRRLLAFRPFQEVEFDETRDFLQVRIAAEPYLLEGFFRPVLYAKAIHGDEHDQPPGCCEMGVRRAPGKLR